MIGQQISHYRILEKLGGGGMGVVYKAQDTKLDRFVALKFLPPHLSQDEENKKRFIHEAKAASALNHPNIATIYEIDEADGQTRREPGIMFIAMEYIEGQSLRALINTPLSPPSRGELKGGVSEGRPLPLDQALNYATQIAEGLQAAHKKGIIHRDIKPANILVTEDGVVKIVDFGLAKLAGKTMLTKEGTTLGTVAYMSPEQARGEPVDHRTDIWALGVILYQMLTGQHPFRGEYEQAVIYSILNEEPESPGALREDLPGELVEIIHRALAKEPEQRMPSCADFLKALQKFRRDEGSHASEASPSSFLLLLKKPKVLALLFLLLIVPGIFYWNSLRGWRAQQNAEALLPEILQATKSGNYAQAYRVALQAGKRLENDSTLARLMPIISNKLTVLSEPAGAKVFLTPFSQNTESSDRTSRLIGVTPIRDLRIARDDYLVRIEKAGYVPAERIASNELARADNPFAPIQNVLVKVRLEPADPSHSDMVRIPGGAYRLVGNGAPTTLEVQLKPYLIDKYEVSNRRFKRFILAGGYTNRAYWKYPFVKQGRTLSWNEARQQFTDRTGLPGPRTWVNQEYPAGQDDYPVTDITWYEAAAYAEFAGKRLPTIFEWEKAARDGAYTHRDGLVMPWGYVGPGQTAEQRANFNGQQTAPVSSCEFGISPYGCYNMAGNVKEWCLNEMTGGYTATGGSWQDPIYLFAQFAAFDGFYSSGALGFRCAIGPDEQGGMTIDLGERTPVYKPVDERSFRSFLSHYRYDKRPIKADVLETKQTPDWVRQKVSFPGPLGDRVLAYLYLPRRAKEPFQCLVYVPSSSVFAGETVAREAEFLLAPHIKSGRAVLAVVLKGMTEREWGSEHVRPAPESVQFREEMVLHATELRMGIDYLETRDDVDMNKLAYVGVSWGSGSRLVFAALDDRFSAVIFIGGGIDERVKPTLPEADNVNFAPYIKPPKLMVNGKYDEEHIWYLRGLPLYNLLSEPKKLVLLEGGHLPAAQLRVPVINAWLDETLGPVKF